MRMKVLFASLLLAASGQVLAQSSGQVGGLYPGWQEIYCKVDFSSIADNQQIPTGMLLPVGICCYIIGILFFLSSVGYHHAESEHIFFEVLLVDGIVLEQGTVVVYGLWRIRQDAGYL